MPSAPNIPAARTLCALTQRFHTALRAAGLAAGLAVLPAAPVWAQAMVQNFDGLACSPDSVPIANGTGGLNWGTFGCWAGAAQQPVSGYAAGTTSAPNIAFNNGEAPATLTRTDGGRFSLTSAQFTAAWHDGLMVRVSGARASGPFVQMDFPVNADAPTLMDLSVFADVDSVTFSSSGGTPHPGYDLVGTWFVMDDLKYVLGAPYRITVDPVPANGTVTCSPNPVPEGGNSVCTATPNAGYVLAGFTGCTRDDTANTCTLTDVRAAATVSATFAAAPAPVPSLGGWALTLLGLSAAGLGARRLRRRG